MSHYVPIAAISQPVVKNSLSKLKSRSLAIQVARRMVLWACFNTLILTAIGYYFVSARAEQRTLAYLSGYLTERLRSESQVFRAGEANLKKFEERFLALYSDPKVLPEPDFDAFFKRTSDGAMRLREHFYTGFVDETGVRRDGTTGSISRNQHRFTPEFKRRLILEYQLVSELGPAWHGSFANLYATTPEDGGVIYWPGVPWGLIGPADHPAHKIYSPTWSPLYFDVVAKRWNVSYERPIFHKGKAIAFTGQDILLDELMSRLIWDHPTGAYNLIVGKGGDLIAHPSRIKSLKGPVRGPKISSLGDKVLESIYRSIAQDSRARPAGAGVRIVENREIDAYVCYGEIGGPGWWFVTIYPRSLVLGSAREAANGLLLLGIGSFAIMTLIVISVLRERVGKPISQMRAASDRVSVGDYDAIVRGDVILPESENNEIGLFAQSFKSMAHKVGNARKHLEETVARRTHELRLANQELEKLSFKDGLTGAYNRRCFDIDLAAAVATDSGSEGVRALLLCDVDHFKLYNDNYGHPAGDRILQLVTEEITRNAPSDRVYRYGGEELAVLLTAPDLEACRATAAKIVSSVARLAMAHEKSPHGIVTISAGLALIEPSGSSSETIIAAADRRLYQAKLLGRNRLVDMETE